VRDVLGQSVNAGDVNSTWVDLDSQAGVDNPFLPLLLGGGEGAR
jgi:hypothetical protein